MGLVHEAASILLVNDLLVILKVVLSKMPIIFVLSSLLSAEYKRFVSLGNISVLIWHLRGGSIIHLMITHTARDSIIVINLLLH